MVPLSMMAQTGTKGNTITIDASNCTVLNSDLPGNASANPPYFSYLRHNQAPIQILNANPTGNNKTIAPLQEANGNGLFANGSFANNMTFTTPGNLEFYNYKGNYGSQCFAIMAPKGYRFTEYWMSICSKTRSDNKMSNSGAAGATISRYTYNTNSTYQYTIATGESLTLTGSNEEIFSHTLSNAGNILYFKIEYTNSSTQWCTHMNELRLTYVIDEEFEAKIPNDNNENQVNTGILNLGQFTKASGSAAYYFEKLNVTDLEDVHIVAENGTTEMSIENGTINVPAGTYWIESPAKFRILGAKLNFQLANEGTTITYTEVQTLESGQKYKISNGGGVYLRLNGSSVSYTTDENAATVWTITGSASSGYTIQSGNYYLNITISGTNVNLATGTSAFSWNYDEQNHYFTWTRDNGYVYGIRYNTTNRWYAARIRNTTYPTPLTFYKQNIVSNEYTATLYGADGETSVGPAEISASKPSASLTASNLNNDGVKFTVTGAAAFTVDLTMEPLDPNVQTLEVGYLPDGTAAAANNSVDNVSVTSSNFKFNNGEVIAVPIRAIDNDDATHQIVFRNAYNESRIDWYDGTATGLSNYHLVGSYDESGTVVTSTEAPYAKVDANQAGTVKLEFSNIKTLTANGGTLTETVFQKSNAGYEDIRLENGEEKDVYIYTADKPLNCIMTAAGKNVNNHIAYTFYEAKVKPIQVNETPVVEVTPVYTKTFKGENTKVAAYNAAMQKNVIINKDTELDTTHTFYGVTVTSKSDVQGVEPSGYLTGEAVVDSIKAKMQEQTGIYSTEDPFRTLLYVDMSSLKSISGDENTWKEIMLGSADNCLFFMPSNFAISQSMPGGGIIAGGEAGVAVTDVTIVDQQPFYTPHSFYTSTHLANYSRKVTPVEGHENTTTVTLVLPFQVNLSANGHLKTASDAVNTDVQFFKLTDQITKNTYNESIYDVTLANAANAAPAGIPYVVKSNAEVTGGTVFGISVLAGRFAKTEGATLEGTDASFTSHGTFSGTVVTDDVFYFSKDYFWNSKTLNPKYVNIRPFRAWYTTSNSTINALARFGMTTDGEATGINDITVDEPTNGVVYDIQGRVVSTTGTSGLSKGLYIMNGKKVFVK